MSDAKRTLTRTETRLLGGMLANITSVAVDSRGRVYVPDGMQKKVVVFNRDGSLAAVWGGGGDGPGEFRMPVAVGIGPDDKAYVLDMLMNSVSVYDASGRFAHRVRVPFSNATDITFAQGLIWTDRQPKSGARIIIGFDPRTGAVRDSAVLPTARELNLAMYGSPPRLTSERSKLAVASPIPGMWYIPKSSKTFGTARYPSATGLMVPRTNPRREVRFTTDEIRGFAVRSDGSAVVAYWHLSHAQAQDTTVMSGETYLEIIAPNGTSVRKAQLPSEWFVRGLAVDGQDILLGVVDEIPQVLRVRLE